MTAEQLMRLVDDFYTDRSRTQTQTRRALEELRDKLDSLIWSLDDDGSESE
jgi:hypothetical protein